MTESDRKTLAQLMLHHAVDKDVPRHDRLDVLCRALGHVYSCGFRDGELATQSEMIERSMGAKEHGGQLDS